MSDSVQGFPWGREIEQAWKVRRADLRLRYSPEEIEKIGLIYYMGCADLLALISARLTNIPPEQRTAWLDSISDECNDKIGAAFPAG